MYAKSLPVRKYSGQGLLSRKSLREMGRIYYRRGTNAHRRMNGWSTNHERSRKGNAEDERGKSHGEDRLRMKVLNTIKQFSIEKITQKTNIGYNEGGLTRFVQISFYNHPQTARDLAV